MPSISWVVRVGDPLVESGVHALRDRLVAAGWPAAPATAGDVVLVWADRPLPAADVDALLGAGRPLLLCGPTLASADPEGGLAEAAGLVVGTRTPPHDVRVRPGRGAPDLDLLDHAHSGASHLGPHTHVHGTVLRLDKVADDVEVLLTGNVALADQPLATWRPGTAVGAWTLGSGPEPLASPVLPRLLLLCLRRVLAVPAPRPVRVGLLGYGAIGHEHARALAAVDGLELAAVCDRSADRLDAARAYARGAALHGDAEALLAEDLDLVVVSTPPRTHAEWAMRVVESGRHVVVEKPFAITTEEADAVLATAAERDKLAVVYQNRRFDPDHLAIRRLVDSGALGEVFHVETFVGGYGHPCNLWHSDEGVSGGAFYDWGSHVLDQLLDLVEAPVEHVTAATHKLVWHDVSNADHSRVTVRFVGGAEAEFVHSDLAAALKPRWYVLGTRGAVVGHWRVERVVSRSDVGTLLEDVLAPADAPPVLDLHGADGSVTRVPTPPPPPYAFHRELADRLRLGLPMTVTGEQSRRVLAVMEAAGQSARSGGRPVRPR